MIKVENLNKYYGDKKALEAVSFSIPKGQIVGLLGLNGAGKSTTMNILTGCISCQDGEVEIDGISVKENPLEAKKKIGYLPETPPLYPDMTVEEYLLFVAELKGVPKAERATQLSDVCEKAGLGEVSSRVIKNLSKGYRQRVGIASALVGNPEIIILDEPTVGLDPSQIKDIRQLIRELGKEKTVILSSHILADVQAVAHRIIVIHGGKIVADDTAEQLESAGNGSTVITVEGSEKAVLEALKMVEGLESVTPIGKVSEKETRFRLKSKAGEDPRKSIFYALSRANLPLISSVPVSLSLEQVFLKLTGGEEDL